MSWLGNAVGAAIGLIALLLGALANAALNRRRDRKMREQESQSIRAAIAADLLGISASTEIAMAFLDRFAAGDLDGYTPDTVAALAQIPDAVVIPKLGERIGLLPPQLAADVIGAWHGLERARVMHGATLAELRAAALDRVRVHTRLGHARDAAVIAQEVAKALSGVEGWFTAKPNQISPAAASAFLSGKPGDLADAQERGG
ncbi:hypothetical protein EA661_13050 [Pseudoxanthomonas winnipegensis]|uniref:Uncharacterized protein n=1 Tax=Pseudoxanthomonas winnipegensis TaxID=2480810 RepID=A0A4Q8LEP3_9GAMM|nr:hypothetical protein [Pseudoxanthomonas winnipegensis]TAA27675.1 hypothetical protein EA661_13050 [Pseudoxanthomonas winnipegensis]